MKYCGIVRADARQLPIADESVQCVITSPPYYGLRDFGHELQVGLERTPDEYVESMVSIFREVRRVLKRDGTLWLNLGDSYAGSWGAQSRSVAWDKRHDVADNDATSTIEGSSMMHARQIAAHPHRLLTGSLKNTPGLKPKDLIGIPWRVAFALQADGWYLRSDIVWHKANPMPESVQDRPTRAHEFIFLLSRSERYYYCAEAIKEKADPTAGRDTSSARRQTGPGKAPDTGFQKGRRFEWRNKRDVWKISTQPYPHSHYATFPPDLVSPCILAGSKVGDFVLDPFAGSGTVAQVAEELCRRWVSVDLAYQDLQKQRLSNLQKELVL